MKALSSGRLAESAAADYLQKLGYKILDQNWKTKYCEIDIVAEKGKQIYFIEVKYRKNSHQGTGFDYITSKKLTQMNFAARVWVKDNGWRGNYHLSGIEVYGPDYRITGFIEDLSYFIRDP